MDKRLMHYQFPRDQIRLEGTMAELPGKVAAVVEDSTDAAIVAAILAAARAEGVTDLYLMDKTFILDAIREKRERENPRPLTIQELIQMQDQPVWLEYQKYPELNRWGVVEGVSEIDGKKYLYLRGEWGYCEYEKGVIAYRHKPKEDTHEQM